MVAACFPEEQAKVYAEIYAITGSERGKRVNALLPIDILLTIYKHRPLLTENPFLKWRRSSRKL